VVASEQNAALITPAHDPLSGIRAWLWLVAALIFAMVAVGGATRLTESGLSITQWKPIAGVVPPLNEADWLVEFDAYKQIPQYQALFPDMSLAQFKTIYFWEWGHRLLGRLIGLAVFVPLLVFGLRRRLPRDLVLPLTGLLGLGALQGAVGWWMVRSGLAERVEVSQYRLAVHLLLACLTFAIVIWLATGLGGEATHATVSPRVRRTASALIGMIFVQIGLGALVAGLRAGLIYNSWPLMDGRLVPPFPDLTALSPPWRNLFENITTVQFDHRLVAYCLVGLAIWHAIDAQRQPDGREVALRAAALAGLAILQAAIGISALVLAVPLWAGLLHQAFALVLFGTAVWHRRLCAGG
jgi:cytochrome c oxidase assembly protein subunit 15